MKLTAINDSTINISGTSLQGYVTTTRAELNKAFGTVEPSPFGDKVIFEWDLHFENEDETLVATIYDYKEERELGIDEVYEWHIGGTSYEAVIQVTSALFERGIYVKGYRSAKEQRYIPPLFASIS